MDFQTECRVELERDSRLGSQDLSSQRMVLASIGDVAGIDRDSRDPVSMGGIRMSDEIGSWAVYNEFLFWLVDTCAGGTWSPQVHQAVWYSSKQDAHDAVKAGEIEEEYELVRVA
jgi:hypothetical protein